MTPGTRRFRRAVSAEDLLIGVNRPGARGGYASYKGFFRRDCALEATRTQVSRLNRDDPHGPARPAFDLHRQCDERRAFRGQEVEVRDVFQAVDVRAVQNLVRDKIFRRAVIDARRINANAVDLSPLRQKLGGFARNAWEMQVGRIAWRVRAQIPLLVRPEFPPPRPDERDRIVGYLPVRLLPRSDVVDCETIIGVLSGGLGNVDHDGRRYQTRNRNLVGGQPALAEMDRRVQ